MAKTFTLRLDYNKLTGYEEDFRNHPLASKALPLTVQVLADLLRARQLGPGHLGDSPDSLLLSRCHTNQDNAS